MKKARCRNIYLHVLDRELRESVRANVDERTLFAALFTALALTPGYLFCSYSHLWESWELVARWQGLIQEFCSNGIILPASGHASVDEFIASRRVLYGHDQDRYPLYFRDADEGPAKVSPRHRTNRSATAVLENLLSDHPERWIEKRDPDQAEHAKHLVGERLSERANRAITSKLFSADAEKDPALPLIRRAISRGYTAHYMAQCGADIVTGITGLELFDSLSVAAPRYDVRLFQAFLKHNAVSVGGANREKALADVATARGSPEHAWFLREWGAFVDSLDIESVARKGQSAAGEAVGRLVEMPSGRVATPASPRFEELAEVLAKMRGDGRGAAPVTSVPTRRVVLVVATDREWRAVNAEAETRGRELVAFPVRGVAVWSIGSIWGWEFLVVRSEMGSTGSGGSLLTTATTIQELAPTFLLMPGIAFGLKPGKQSLGDLLVAAYVRDYETVRAGEAGIVERGPSFPCGSELLAKARLQARASEHIHFGEVICGCKLVDYEKLVVELRARFPDAIGGEMEGNGLGAAALRDQVPWLLVKGICDWGFGKDDKQQYEAALNAVRFCLGVMEHVIP